MNCTICNYYPCACQGGYGGIGGMVGGGVIGGASYGVSPGLIGSGGVIGGIGSTYTSQTVTSQGLYNQGIVGASYGGSYGGTHCGIPMTTGLIQPAQTYVTETTVSSGVGCAGGMCSSCGYPLQSCTCAGTFY